MHVKNLFTIKIYDFKRETDSNSVVYWQGGGKDEHK